MSATLALPVDLPSDATTAHLSELSRTRDDIASYILSTADFTRRDRLWPAHYELFGTNPMSLAYGASGIAMMISEISGALPDDVKRWMADQPLPTEVYPPALYTGLSGIAYALFESGLHGEAEAALQKAYDSPLLFADSGMLFGVAGWGLASLYFHDRTGDDRYLESAVRAGRHLVDTAIQDADGLAWEFAREQRVHFGWGFGSSGIGTFLLYLGLRTADRQLLDHARAALDFDLAQAQETPNGVSWGRYKDDVITLPYWMHGGAGVGTAAIRFYHHLGDERYLQWAERIADGAAIKWSVLPSLLEGLSGIGEFMIDMYLATGTDRYRRMSLDLAETVLLFRIPKPTGVAFPGRWLTRISTDYATGSAGIAQFLGRAVNPGPRRLVDLPSASLQELR
jgi:lantibiotic modifying enzyme